MSSAAPRSPLIDTLKGLACATIVWHHLAFYGPMSDVAMAWFPGVLAWLYEYGRMAVQVFLVLGGYLAMASLAPQGLARFDSAPLQVARRYVRLAIPYAVALLVAVLVAALVRPWFAHPSVPAEPSLPQLLANALLLQDIVGEEALSAGVWYVAIDFQLFALLVLLLAGVRALPGLAPGQRVLLVRVLVVAGTAASLLVFNRHSGLDMWALYFMGAYGLGVMAFWAVRSSRPALWLGGMAVLGALALALDFRARILVALVSALGLAWPGRCGARGACPPCQRWRCCSAWGRCRTPSFWCTFRSVCWSTRWCTRCGPRRSGPMRWACWRPLVCRWPPGACSTGPWNAPRPPGRWPCAGKPVWWVPACWWRCLTGCCDAWGQAVQVLVTGVPRGCGPCAASR